MIDNNKLAVLIKLLVDIIEEATPGELDELRSHRLADLLLPLRTSRSAKRPSSSHDRSMELEIMPNALYGAQSREEAVFLLNKAALPKKDLEQLARSLDLPISKEDGVSRLVERIVEATVGSRLSSEAIRNGTKPALG